MTNEEYLLNRILSELEYINSRTNSIESNVDLITNETIEIREQLTKSGDSIILNKIDNTNNGIGLIAIIGILFIIYYFIMRCLK